ncbi:MAG: OsmC family protein, partial [Myxococcota bacterium]
MEMQITFPGGKRVDATLLGRTIHTDQAKENGGDGTAPEPYMMFLASLGTCAGVYVLGFCQARDLPTEGISLVQHH